MTVLPDVSDVAALPTRWIGAGRLCVQVALRRFDVDVQGRQHVPRHGPFVLASNHMGYIDGPLLFAVSPRKVHTLVKTEMFEGMLGFALSLVGQIPVERRTNDLLAVKRCLRTLYDGGGVAIFPEGARGRGDVARCRRGAAYLAMVTGAPVIPVACLGTRDDGASTSAMPHPGARLDVRFGEPMRFERHDWPRTKKEVGAVTDAIHDALARHVQRAAADTGHAFPSLPEGEE